MNDFFYNILTNYYDLGQLVRITRNHRGYFNETYEIESFKDKKECRWILRRYREGGLEEKIKFEHALLLELAQRGFEICPRVIPTKDNTTLLKFPKETEKGGDETYIAVFSCLPGKDKYSWDQPLCTDMELRNAAEILASYHTAIYQWESEINWTEPRDIDKVSGMPDQLTRYLQNAGTSVFDQYFAKHFDYLFKIFKKFKKKSVYNAMPHLAAHGDYHPGNLKFQHGKVSGVFDFDWSKMDLRCLDVGRGIYFFCTAWEGSSDGKLLFHRVNSFLEAYQSAAKELNGIGPLGRAEREHLFEMIHLSNLCVICWALDEFYNTDCDPREYLTYLRHSVRCIQWMADNRNRLSQSVFNH